MPQQLPTEILIKILLYCCDKELIVALQVNSPFYELAGTILYRPVDTCNIRNLFTGANLARICKRRSRATIIKSLLIRQVRHLHLRLGVHETKKQLRLPPVSSSYHHPGPAKLLRMDRIVKRLPTCLPKLDTLALGGSRIDARLVWRDHSSLLNPSHERSTGLANLLIERCRPTYLCLNPDDGPITIRLGTEPLKHSPDIVTWHATRYTALDLNLFWGTCNRVYHLDQANDPDELCGRRCIRRFSEWDDWVIRWMQRIFQEIRPIGPRGNASKTRFEIYATEPSPEEFDILDGCPEDTSVRRTTFLQNLLDGKMTGWTEEEKSSVEIFVGTWAYRPQCPCCQVVHVDPEVPVGSDYEA